jgi:asparagine synthase (glutamine-hydrolysing)
MPDSAFILLAWRRWGSDCPTHLMGAYAFAIYNSRDETLFVARSPRGERTLLYVLRPELFAFSTAPKGLFALPFIRRELDLSRVADHLLMKYYDQDSTFYAGINMLRPGHAMFVRRDSQHVRRFWSVESLPPIRFRRDDEYVEAFCHLFDRAVNDSMRSASPLGLTMSGGLDSTAVGAAAALALAKTGRKLATFTEVPEDAAAVPEVAGRYPDETHLVEAMIRRYPNMEATYVRTPEKFFLRGSEQFFEAAEVPFRNASNRVWLEEILDQARQRGIRTLLSGVRGNHTISWGGIRLLPQLIGQLRWSRALAEARGIARAGRSGQFTAKALILGLLPLLPEPLWVTLHRLKRPRDPLFFRKPWKAYSCIRDEFFSDQKLAAKATTEGHNWQFRSLAASRREQIERGDIGAEIARGHEAMFGVETRDPTDDRRIVEFCLSIPEEQYLRNGTDRWLIRRAISARAPAEILHNRKRGLQASDWLNRLIGARAEVIEELDRLERCNLARYVIDLRELRRLVSNIPQDARLAGPDTMWLRAKLDLGLMTGRFLRWFESGT